MLTLFVDATRINLQVLKSNESLPIRLLGIGMLPTILLGAIGAAIVFPQLSIWEVGILAAILAPTDAGLGEVVVKRPDAFALLGLLKALFPNARFVNTVRDARDTCLSIWFQQFDGRISYANDLADIAHHYRQYRRLMAHWREVLGDSLFDADYDRFVTEPRPVTENLLGFLGLDWHEGCLEPQRTATRVRTASVGQVRQPLYRRSSGRWRNYEKQLSGLARLL